MGEESRKQEVKGLFDQITGRIKEFFGHMLGSDHARAEGRAQELEGRAKVEGAQAVQKGEAVVQQTTGTAERKIGEMLGSERMAAEGRAKELEGQQRQTH
jgi:uncharacterized protein YjbJ (UPF0337 family)